MADKKWLLGPQLNKKGLSGPQPSRQGLSGPQPNRQGLSGPQPSRQGLSGPQPSRQGLSGPPPSRKGLSGPQPSRQGLSGPPPSRKGLSGPQPNRQGLSGPQPSRQGLSGPQPNKEGLSGPQPSRKGLSGPQPSRKGLSGPQPNRKGLLGLEPNKQELSGPQPNKEELSEPQPNKEGLSGPQPNRKGLLGTELNRKGLFRMELNKWGLLGTELDRKGMFRRPTNQKGLFGSELLEPVPLGMPRKPWYRDPDKLPSSCFSKHKGRLLKCPTSLDTRRWRFVKKGLDDFRTGCPSCENLITRGPREGFLPIISHRGPRPPPKRSQKNLPKGLDLCSKLSPAQQARKAYVESIEASLIKHPLARYPHLEEDLPADLLLKVLQVLDPDRKLEDTWVYCENALEGKKSPTELCEKHPDKVYLEPPDKVNLESSDEVNLEAPHKATLEAPDKDNLEAPDKANLEAPDKANPEAPDRANLEAPDKDNLEAPDKDNLEAPDKVDMEPPRESLLSYLTKLFPEQKKTKKSNRKGIPKGPSLDQRPPRAVRNFCKWIEDTFGDLGIDEEFIMKQFEIDHECPLTHNTVKIKKVSQIPMELKYCDQLDEIKQRKFSLQESSWERKLRKREDPYKPKRVKIRYGAWYLEPKSWKKLINDEPLLDPKAVLEEQYRNYGRHMEPDIIDDLYGPIAFKDFIVSKGYRMPGVLEKLFIRKGWTYDSVKTPIHRVMKLLSKANNDAEEED